MEYIGPEDDLVKYLREDVDLFSVCKTKEEINKLISNYGVKVLPKVSNEGQAYQSVEGEYSQVVGFLSDVFDMHVCEVMSNIGNEVWWSRPGREG